MLRWKWQALGLGLLLLAVQLAPRGVPVAKGDGWNIHLDGWDQLLKVVDEVNAERLKAGLQPVKIESHLQTTAWNYAALIAKLDKWDKTTHFEDGGKTPFQRAQANGYKGHWVGENWAGNFKADAHRVMYGPGWCWMNSPPHKANILFPGARDVGVAAWMSKSGHLYWVLVLGQP